MRDAIGDGRDNGSYDEDGCRRAEGIHFLQEIEEYLRPNSERIDPVSLGDLQPKGRRVHERHIVGRHHNIGLKRPEEWPSPGLAQII